MRSDGKYFKIGFFRGETPEEIVKRLKWNYAKKAVLFEADLDRVRI